MTYADSLQAALNRYLGKRVHYMSGWRNDFTGPWKGPKSRPVGLVLHHTAGAKTESIDPTAAGNQHGANNAVIMYVARHFKVPASNFCLDRDGCLFVMAAGPVWHAGLGAFTKTPWTGLGVPRNQGNRYLLGVEVVDRGLHRSFTKAQRESLARLAQACAKASGWEGTSTKRLPRHRDYAGLRKIDIRYDNSEVQAWIRDFGK
jgi:N-acetyl-anhydromuramyl-L-alanine amidase AmpD